MQKPVLELTPWTLAVFRLEPFEDLPSWVVKGDFYSVTRTNEELSYVVPVSRIPEGIKTSNCWKAIKVQGLLDFSQTGILSAIAVPLAEAGISIFAISTFDTDYILIKEETVDRAISVLKTSGYTINV